MTTNTHSLYATNLLKQPDLTPPYRISFQAPQRQTVCLPNGRFYTRQWPSKDELKTYEFNVLNHYLPGPSLLGSKNHDVFRPEEE